VACAAHARKVVGGGVTGYQLSCDLGSSGHMMCLYYSRNRRSVSPIAGPADVSAQSTSVFGWAAAAERHNLICLWSQQTHFDNPSLALPG
jgi:hypothetical protein